MAPGTGTLEKARGGSHLITGKTTINTGTTLTTTTENELTGEKDIFGKSYSTATRSLQEAAETPREVPPEETVMTLPELSELPPAE
mgnify:CR=1 FL=1